jgi:hypothetical protein
MIAAPHRFSAPSPMKSVQFSSRLDSGADLNPNQLIVRSAKPNVGSYSGPNVQSQNQAVSLYRPNDPIEEVEKLTGQDSPQEKTLSAKQIGSDPFFDKFQEYLMNSDHSDSNIEELSKSAMESLLTIQVYLFFCQAAKTFK